MALILWIFDSIPNAWVWAWLSFTLISLGLTYLAPSFLLPIIKSLNNENIDSLSAGTLGGAIGLAVGYGIGRIKK